MIPTGPLHQQPVWPWKKGPPSATNRRSKGRVDDSCLKSRVLTVVLTWLCLSVPDSSRLRLTVSSPLETGAGDISVADLWEEAKAGLGVCLCHTELRALYVRAGDTRLQLFPKLPRESPRRHSACRLNPGVILKLKDSHFCLQRPIFF